MTNLLFASLLVPHSKVEEGYHTENTEQSLVVIRFYSNILDQKFADLGLCFSYLAVGCLVTLL